MNTAVVVGATGLVGSHLLRLLLDDIRFDEVVVLTRRSTGVVHAKLVEHIIDFDDVVAWRELVRGDVLFSALGTTIRQAGSRDAQWKVDHTYQLEAARAAAANGVPAFVLVSAAGASPSSRVFYSRMKGELEHDVATLGFSTLHILQPGLLAGRQHDTRAGERIGETVLTGLNMIGLFRQWRPIHGRQVAQAMINASFDQGRSATHPPAEVFKLAAS